MDQFETSVTVDIARFMRKFCLKFDRAVDIDGDHINNICNTLTTRFI